MKAGVRALGVAESFGQDRATSTLAGAVVRADRVVDGFTFVETTVGGTDATDAVVSLFERLDREDVRYLLVGGVALSWYNLVDLQAVHADVDRPVLSVTFEASDGLEPAIREAFDDEAAVAERLAVYESLPDRRPVDCGDETIYVRAVGCADDEAREVVHGFTPEGGRPDPVRVARLAARGADDLRR